MSQSELVCITIPPHSADVMLMNAAEEAQPQNCPLPFTADGGERARSGDTETVPGNLMMQPGNSEQPAC